MENVRYNISPCSPQEADGFITKIDETVYVPRGIVRADERSHYDRYAYTRGDSKVAVVYDTFAHVISITAPKAHADELLMLFSADGSKTVKTSTVPAQGGTQIKQDQKPTADGASKRAKLFVSPEKIRRNPSYTPITVFATAKGAEISTDEIYPPQRARKRTEFNAPADGVASRDRVSEQAASTPFEPTVRQADDRQSVGMTIAAGTARSGNPRRATISFGDEDYRDGKTDAKRATSRPSGTGIFADLATAQQPQKDASEPSGAEQTVVQPKRKRGRPPKNRQAEQQQQPVAPAPQQGAPRKRGRPPKLNRTQQGALVTAPGYTPDNEPSEPIEYSLRFSRQNMADLFVRLKKSQMVLTPETGISDAVAYMVADGKGQKVALFFSEKRYTLRISGPSSELFRAVKSYAEKLVAKNPVVIMPSPRAEQAQVDVAALSEPMRKLYRRIPTAFTYLSESSRNNFAGALQDFSQPDLNISDYSGLLVQPYRALEKFIFDLQRAEGIQVKMIGQAYDKDERGRYILKRGYQQRIKSVVYAEVMVALYTEYFMQRNFIVHTDNTDDSNSRALPDRSAAKKIFDGLLDVVEYNSCKLKEIGFGMDTEN